MDKRHIETLVLATHNPGKVKEIGVLLEPYGVTVKSAGELGLPEPEETGTTFAGNAAIKSLAAAKGANLPALSDDSGLCVDALDGEPGIYSARWAGPDKDFSAAMEKVNEKLGDSANRAAHFLCVLALSWPDGETELFEGRIDGTLVWPPRGEKGFGFDPMFVPEGEQDTFAEMDPGRKASMSHRSRAFAKLVQAVFEPAIRRNENA
ncbi:MAG: RdgB/HAM1 family non-canonical purine NTP pyrophosphatase [Alphaproteobacteria bacterium]|nr:RdgB/HAM1 family non-canonical purine NTP pyrophosphatase [Alphaproteobacteria bacterium]